MAAKAPGPAGRPETVAFRQLAHAVRVLHESDIGQLCKADVSGYHPDIRTPPEMLDELSKAFRDLAYKADRHARAMRTDV